MQCGFMPILRSMQISCTVSEMSRTQRSRVSVAKRRSHCSSHFVHKNLHKEYHKNYYLHRLKGYVFIAACVSVSAQNISKSYERVFWRGEAWNDRLHFGGKSDPVPLFCPSFSPLPRNAFSTGQQWLFTIIHQLAALVLAEVYLLYGVSK